MAAGQLEEGSDSLRWDLLETQPPSGERLTVRLAMPRRRTDLFIGLDSSGRRHVLVQIPSGEPSELSERTSRGIGVQTVEMKVDDGQLRTFVNVACLEPQGHAALDVIVAEIADALDKGASIGRVALVQNVLGKWRRFWSGVSQGLLSREEQLGLFGELWFLSYWLGPSIGLSNAVGMWRGPLGARHDFEARMIGIEVKTSGRSDGAHHINGLEQLEQPAGGALLLMSIAVRDEASATDCLPDIIEHIRQGLAEDYSALSRFDSCLYAAGYMDDVAREYAKLKLRVRVEALYRVEGNFPRLVPSNLKEPLPSGIDSVGYQLNLGAADTWRLATTAESGKSLLRDFCHNQ